MTTIHINDWIEFEYTDLNKVTKVWAGEVVEQHLWGYKIFTNDGYRSFRFGKMRNIKHLV